MDVQYERDQPLTVMKTEARAKPETMALLSSAVGSRVSQFTQTRHYNEALADGVANAVKERLMASIVILDKLDESQLQVLSETEVQVNMNNVTNLSPQWNMRLGCDDFPDTQAALIEAMEQHSNHKVKRARGWDSCVETSEPEKLVAAFNDWMPDVVKAEMGPVDWDKLCEQAKESSMAMHKAKETGGRGFLAAR